MSSNTDLKQRRSRPSRRASSDVHRAIVESARSLFARKGYGVTSFREIAELAGVYEPMIYRRFSSKAALFQAAVLDPLNLVIADYLTSPDSPAAHSDATLEERVRSFVPPLYRIMTEERELILALLSAEEFHPEELGDLTNSFSAGVRRLVDVMAPHVVQDIDAPAALLSAFGLALGVSLLHGALTSEVGQDLSQNDRMVEELVAFTLYGVSARPGAGGKRTAPTASAHQAAAEWFDRIADAERRAVRAELEVEYLRRQLLEQETRHNPSQKAGE